MGGLQSTFKMRANKIAVTNSRGESIQAVLPVYYTKEELTKAELEAATKVWSWITTSRAATYINLKKNNPKFGFANCSEYFYEIFNEELLDFHPGAKALFKKGNKRMQQNFIGAFTMLLDCIQDDEKFSRSLASLASVHNNIGVKAIECKLIISSHISPFIHFQC